MIYILYVCYICIHTYMYIYYICVYVYIYIYILYMRKGTLGRQTPSYHPYSSLLLWQENSNLRGQAESASVNLKT